ncbi:MAG: hypothetical protein A4E19_01235 [Nitrospira sp. SG-bin1]|nr:MAG: hypothetical protein A4E19_01235 [Nitrospira sp. SG-bin1]
MRDTPLIGPYRPDDVLAWRQAGPRTARQFLADVLCLTELLPDRPVALNLATSRYEFLVGFAAAMLRQQVTLLPHNRAPEALRRLIEEYPDYYALTDSGEAIAGVASVAVQSPDRQVLEMVAVPEIPVNQAVAVAFTSGSTGTPKRNTKTWGALTAVAQATGARLGMRPGGRTTVVATVPHQHMFGLEASVMLPILHGLTMHAARPLFPADVESALSEANGPWLLVTTPLHLRACVAERISVPPGGIVLSATAPLPRNLAQEAERQFQAEVHEIFGFAEAGSVAERRTVEEDLWRPLDGVRVTQSHASCAVHAWYLADPVTVPDRIIVDPQGAFIVQGREEDHVNVAGHRVSLGDLNRKLLQIDGVEDGVFFLPDEEAGSVTRLMAFVVAPGQTSEDVQKALRACIDPVFLPRPLVCVPSLPRNGTGKLPREAVSELARHWLEKEENDGA